MDKIKFNFDDSEIKELLFKVLDEKDYWVQKIERDKYDELKGTIITLKPYDETKRKVEVQFLNEKLDVEGLVSSEIVKLTTYYRFMVCEKIEEYKKEEKKSKKIIDEFVKEFSLKLKNSLIEDLLQTKFENSSQIIGKKLESYKLPSQIPMLERFKNHCTFYVLPQNNYNKQDREVKVGQVYYVNLDPIVGTEFGGRRPALIIGYTQDKDIYYCIPFSTKKSMGIEIGKIDEEDSYAVVSRIKAISKERIYEYILDLDEEKYNNILKEVQMKNFLYETINDNSKLNIFKKEEIKTSEEDTNKEDNITFMTNNISAPVNSPLEIELLNKSLIKPTEEEIYKIVEIWSVAKKKFGYNFMTDSSGKLQYEFILKNNYMIVNLNKNHVDYANKYLPFKLTFALHDVYVSDDGGISRGEKDVALIRNYQRLRIAKDENYYISLFDRFVHKTFLSYKKYEENDEDCTELDRKVNTLKNNAESLNIYYNGSYQDLVLKGVKALNYDLIEYRDKDENEME